MFPGSIQARPTLSSLLLGSGQEYCELLLGAQPYHHDFLSFSVNHVTVLAKL